jgi:predicted HicB family RNase H-like nuclease
MEIMKYKGYEGTAVVDVENQVCHGKLLFMNDLVTYEAESPKLLFDAFREAVEDYIETCKDLGRSPEKTLKGLFNVRIPPDLHKDAIRKSLQLGITLNETVVRALDFFINGNSAVNHVTNYFVQNGEPKYTKLDLNPLNTNMRWLSSAKITKGVKSGN